ncbi:MAG: hypothetical protein A2Y07_06845 [Planctomycetes bacterium GWF2_50_10]|nr:MAG: hypothetical protein A2Y07_06845 [Planctomycetes bacterium GWF2_50_10]
MPITVEEKFDSGGIVRGQQGSATRLYIIAGTDDDIAAADALVVFRPATVDGLPAQTAEVEWLAPNYWLGKVRYGYTNQNQGGADALYSFDTGGGSQHITQSFSTINRYAPAGKTAPNFEGAIGVDDNSVNGCDIIVPTYSFSETYIMDASRITDAYKSTLFNLTGKVNSAPWRHYQQGEVLFQGASGSKRGKGDWELAFKFSASPNKTNVTIGSITGISKKGWEYLWVRYADADDTGAKALIKKPLAVYIEQVYEYGNFAGLGV